MNRNEKLLEKILSEIVLKTPEEALSYLPSRALESWKVRLKSIYPQLTYKLGRRSDDIFRKYLVQNPPHDWNMQFFGGDLPKFLKEEFKKYDRHLPEIADFEWTLYWVQRVPTLELRAESYVLNPLMRILRFQYSIWKWWQHKKNLPQLEPELIVVSRKAKGEVEIFEPNIVEAAVIDSVGDLSLDLNSLVGQVGLALSDVGVEQIRLAIDSLIDRGVLYAPVVRI